MAIGKQSVVHKLAVILASLPPPAAGKIMKKFSPKTMERVVGEIQGLGEITTEERDDAFSEFAGSIEKNSNVFRVQGESVARALLTDVVGEAGANDMLDKAKKAQAFSMLGAVNGRDLAAILSKEQPSTAALILGFLTPKKTGEIFEFFDKEFREEVIVRLAKKRQTDSEVVDRIEKIFSEKITSMVSTAANEEQQQKELGGPNYVAELFQNVDRTVEDELLDAIKENSEELANEVRDLMFTFDDIIKLGDVEMQRILREVPMDKLVIVLRGANPAVADKFTKNLSKRARENLNEEMGLMGKLKVSEVDAERRNVVKIVRSLEAAGEIKLSRGGESQDEYV